jgi:CheY-like chemotaxis protein
VEDINVTPCSILIIDDDEPTRAFLRQVLEKAGYLVMEASNGQAGLRQFRQTPAALVITDLLMPDQDGLEVTKALHREAPHVKIIVLTGASEELDFLDAATILGAHRTMKKPVTKAELLHAVQEELEGDSLHKGDGLQGAR